MKKRLSKKKSIIISVIFLVLVLIGSIVTILIIKENSNNSNYYSDGSSTQKWFEDIDDTHVSENSDVGKYINNRIIVFFKRDYSENQLQAVLNSINGIILGTNGDGVYQIEIPTTNSYEELKTITGNVKKMEGVFTCQIETIIEFISQAIPNDPWKDTFQGLLGTDWDEANPDGLNWGLETIQASSAWEYKNRFSSIKIGVVDNGFDINHEDLEITMINPDENSKEDHGTHVAGIIGATANNEKGITGIVWNKELYCADVSATKKQEKKGITVLNQFDGIEELLKKGCKVINMSMGGFKNGQEIINSGAQAAGWILYWEDVLKIEDFIIVQGAGNNKADSTSTGLFASITDESIELMFNENDKSYRELYNNSDIYKHFLIVGAVQKNKNGYELVNGFNPLKGFGIKELLQWENYYTCYGDNISIVAPGKDIFSTVVSDGVNGSYGYDTGTSMAAPMVTGVASLVWSVNPQFTAEEVKEIVCSNTKDVATGYDEADTRRYPIVNAKLAVEEAIKRTDNLIVGAVKDKATNNPITDVSVDVIIPGSGSTKIVASTTTNNSGEFELKLPKGTYTIVFAHDDYKRFAYNVTVDTDDITLNAPILLTPSNSIQDNEYMVNLVGITVNELASIYGSDYDVMWHWDGTRRVLYYSDKRTSCMFEIHEISESLSLNGSERIERLEYPIERRGGLGPITKELDAHMEYQDIQNVLNLELTWDELGYYLDYDYNDDINITFFYDTKPEPTTLPSKVGILSHKLYLSSVPDTYEEDESTLNDASSFTNEPKYPTSQKYWVIFKEGFRNDRIEMSTFDTELEEGSFHIIWDGNLLLNNDDGMSRCEQFSIVNNQWNKDREYGILTDWATEIIASNVDIYDGEGNLIKAKTDYSKISMDMLQ